MKSGSSMAITRPSARRVNRDRKSTRLNSSHVSISYAVFCLKKKKHVERKMMCEAFRRLTEFGAMESYRYIGFGSPYFADSQMSHKHRNVQDMVCIAVDAEHR